MALADWQEVEPLAVAAARRLGLCEDDQEEAVAATRELCLRPGPEPLRQRVRFGPRRWAKREGHERHHAEPLTELLVEVLPDPRPTPAEALLAAEAEAEWLAIPAEDRQLLETFARRGELARVARVTGRSERRLHVLRERAQRRLRRTMERS